MQPEAANQNVIHLPLFRSALLQARKLLTAPTAQRPTVLLESLLALIHAPVGLLLHYPAAHADANVLARSADLQTQRSFFKLDDRDPVGEICERLTPSVERWISLCIALPNSAGWLRVVARADATSTFTKIEADVAVALMDVLGDLALTPSNPTTQLLKRLTPDQRDTLERLLRGDSEKQIAACRLKSSHTIHSQIRRIYQQFNLTSRAQLIAHFAAHDAQPIASPD